jgi:hypothetical protein
MNLLKVAGPSGVRSAWDALADLEQKKGAAPIADRVYPWLISHAALSGPINPQSTGVRFEPKCDLRE